MRISDWSSDVCSSDLRALEEAGLPVDPALVVPAHFEIEFAEAVVDTLIARQVDFDAIFAASDMLALGAIRSLLPAGCSVPGAVSVVGYDDVQFARYNHPALTTIPQNTGQTGRLPASNLLNSLHAEDMRPERVTPPPNVRD